MKKQDHHLFLSWLVLTGVIIFAAVIAWNQGLFKILFSSDKSNISMAICLIYTLGMLHCAYRAWQISKQLVLAKQVESIIHQHKKQSVVMNKEQLTIGNRNPFPQSIVLDFLTDTVEANQNKLSEQTGSALAEVYSDKMKSSHEYGWFFVDAIIKLGLLGTIVGFILMLGSVSDSSTLDINAMQKVLQQMSSGMGTALYTTLAGLICSMLLAIQYQMLDRGADDVMHSAVHLAEVHILPNTKTSTKPH